MLCRGALAATGEQFDLIFPEGTDIAFIDEVYGRSDEALLDAAFADIWTRPVSVVAPVDLHQLARQARRFLGWCTLGGRSFRGTQKPASIMIRRTQALKSQYRAARAASRPPGSGQSRRSCHGSNRARATPGRAATGDGELAPFARYEAARAVLPVALHQSLDTALGDPQLLGGAPDHQAVLHHGLYHLSRSSSRIVTVRISACPWRPPVSDGRKAASLPVWQALRQF